MSDEDTDYWDCEPNGFDPETADDIDEDVSLKEWIEQGGLEGVEL